MTQHEPGSIRERLTAPRAAGVAGVLFAILSITSIVLMRTALDDQADASGVWAGPAVGQITFALNLMPYAGIAFLWFIGVVRDRLGDQEDKFFASIFFGSGLIFIAMFFVSAAIAGGILAAAQSDATSAPAVITFARAEMLEVTNVYALRMAGVFMVSLGTVWLRTGLMPRWTVILTYVMALALLVMINFSLWLQLLFPAWTLLISMMILIMAARNKTGVHLHPERGYEQK